MKHEFNAEIKRLEGKIKWNVIYFPHTASEHFGTNGRVNVKTVVDGHEFDSMLLPSHNGHYLVYNSTMKKAVGKELGDTVQVILDKCEEKRELVIPDYISIALKENAAFDKFLEMPNYIKRDEITKIESAKRDETRLKRLQALIVKLADN